MMGTGSTLTMTNSSGTTAYTWDFENRLVSAALPGSSGTVSFKYDPFGRRIEKISPNATSIFAYDGDNLVETANASGGVVARYSQGLNIDEPLAELRGTATDYYEADGLGSVSSLTDTTGALAQTYTYDSFGNTLASTGTLRNYFQYTGREWDSETSLYYYRARYYDPQAGRFTSEDPADFLGGTNFYDYVANDPVVFVDPWGLWHCAAGVDCNITPELKNSLTCFDKCTGSETIVTSARRPPTPKHPNSSHSRGEACDVGRNNNPGLSPDQAKNCFLTCFPHGYGQEENNQGPGTHYHFQLNPVPGGKPGFAIGIQPYNP